MTFINDLVSQISAIGKPLHKIKIIVPSKRAIKYIKETLATTSPVPQFAPEITTISDWIEDSSEYQFAKPIESIVALFEIHLSFNTDQYNTFDQFFSWGKSLLSDFDEIDRYLVNPTEIYRDLRNIKEIENWSFNSEELSPGQQNFLDFWLLLQEYYQKLNAQLKEKGKCYAGHAFKQAALAPQQLNPQQKHLFFAGFNALSKSEEQIINYFLQQEKASILWDTDQLYWDNKEHEAGHFIRKFYQGQNRNFDIPSHLSQYPKKIDIWSTPTQTLQAKWCASELAKAVKNETIDETALVLADESLLIPILNNLPASIKKANITIGLPLKNTGVKSLVYLFFQVKKSFDRYKTKAVYFKLILEFIQHPFIQAWCKSEDREILRTLERNIIRSNYSFVSAATMQFEDEALQQLFQLFFKPHSNFITSYQDLLNLIRLLYVRLVDETTPIQAESCYLFYNKIKELEDFVTSFKWDIDIATIAKLIETHYLKEGISFFGSPTKGLQIMGVLETRLLDFKHLIVVGMNEGALPAKNFNNSMIPMDLKIHHGLPTPEDKEAIFSHHFFRLLHRAETVAISYSTDQETNAEKSRYIRQLENELPRINNDLDITIHHLKTELKSAKTTTSDIPTSEKIQERIAELLAYGLSPSAINTYRNCSKDFYYRYVLGLKEKESVEEDIESSTFGTIIHETLEELYLPFVNKNVHTHDIEEMEKKVDRVLNKYYSKYFQKESFNTGKNLLSYQSSLSMIKRFLKQEIDFLKSSTSPVFILALEKELSYETTIELNGTQIPLKFKGNADRIDRVGNTLRIIDYKTGGCDKDKVSVTTLDNYLKLDGKNTYPLQLMLYFLMFSKNNPHETQLTSGIISLRNSSNGLMNVPNPLNKGSEFLTPELAEAYEETLKELINDLLSNQMEFTHNSDSKYCDYC